MRHEFVIARRTDSDAYTLWRFDPDAPELLTPVPLAPGASFDRTHQLAQIGSYLIEWGPVLLPKYQASFPYRLFAFDPASTDPLNVPAHQQGLWPKTKFWAYRPDFGNPHGANEGFDRGDQLLLLPLGGFMLNVIPTDDRGTYQLWNFDPALTKYAPGDPLPAPYTPQGSFDQIQADQELLAMGNHVLTRDRKACSFAVYSFDPQGQPPLALPTLSEGVWPDIDAGHELVAIGDLVLDWTPADRRWRLWQFDPQARGGARALTGPNGSPLRTGTFPPGFDVGTTLFGFQPPMPIDTARAATPGTTDFMRSKVKHVVYLMLENRSFDHLVGWLYKKGDAGIHYVGHDQPFNGASLDTFNLDPSTSPPTKVFVEQWNHGEPGNDQKSTDFLPQDPYHDKSDVMRQYFFNDRRGYQQRLTPDMGGFVWNNGVNQVMWTYTPEQLPVINGLAKNFALSDEWFCSMPGATDPNRAFAFSGSAMMKLNNWQNGNDYIYWPDFAHRQSLWKVLWSNGVSDWKIYNSVQWQGFVHTYHLYLQGQIPTVDAQPSNWIAGIDDFKSAAKAGKLPAFSFLEPAWIATVGTSSYHPGADLIPGERALEEIYEAIRNGPAWNETMLIVTFDEHGGIHDHVAPPYAANPWPNDVNDGFRYDMMGVRVPAIVISPYVEAQTVFRSGKDTPFDHTSILATVLDWFGVPRARWALGDRTAAAPTFETVFTRATPRTDAPTSLPVPHDKSFPPEGGTTTALPVHDLHRLMAPRAVWAILKGKASPQDAQRIADEILAESNDLQTLSARLSQLAQAHG